MSFNRWLQTWNETIDSIVARFARPSRCDSDLQALRRCMDLLRSDPEFPNSATAIPVQETRPRPRPARRAA